MRNNWTYGSLFSYFNAAADEVPLDLPGIFGRTAPVEVEIGFGTGEYLCGLSAANPDTDYLGLEQCAGRILKSLRKLHASGVRNVRLVKLDAGWAFRYFLKPGSLRAVHSLFPCPWPKKRHAKHRLFNRAFLALAGSRLEPGGTLRIVTDHGPYADWISEEFLLPETMSGLSLSRQIIPPLHGTKFEKKWQEAGQHEFHELVLRRIGEIESFDGRKDNVKTYFLERIDPAKVEFEALSGPVSVHFQDFMFDGGRKRGMVQAVIGEDNRTQYLWVLITHTSKGWCVRPAPGMCVLPTHGVQAALDQVYAALKASGQA